MKYSIGNTTHWLQSHQAPFFIGSISLIVTDIEFVTRFYRQIIGLDIIVDSPKEAQLGSGGVVYLKLISDSKAELQAHNAPGLFHTAFLVPKRADLAAFLANAITKNVKIEGASDHAVSEAVYLSDPEGNGIEIYVDRPRAEWIWHGAEVHMTTAPLNVRQLLSEASPASNASFHIAAGSRIGHVHLRVPAIDKSRELFSGVWGLDITHQRPGAAFYSSGGYHHHIAGNTWQSQNSPPRKTGQTGLANIEIFAADAASFAYLSERWTQNGGRILSDHASIKTEWGGSLTLRIKPEVY